MSIANAVNSCIMKKRTLLFANYSLPLKLVHSTGVDNFFKIIIVAIVELACFIFL